jgi:nitrite reductase/ring-hydroxylating ferredoxin subunit
MFRMRDFICEHCGAAIIDSPHGYLNECPHYYKERAKRVIVEQKEIKRKVKQWMKQNNLK